MEDMFFDVNGILSDEEAAKAFGEEPLEEKEPEKTPAEKDKDGVGLAEVPDFKDIEEIKDEPEEEEEKEPEKVGNGKKNDSKVKEDAAVKKAKGSSPNVFSSIAKDLKANGIFPDLEDDSLENVKTPEDFAELFEKAVQSRLDEKQRRIDQALGYGMEPQRVRSYQAAIDELDGYTEEQIKEEGEDGDKLRQYLIYNDFIARGFSEERAVRETKKSFDAGTEVTDALEAASSLKSFYENKFKEEQKEAKQKYDAMVADQKKRSEDYKKLVMDSDKVLGDLQVDKRTLQKVLDVTSKPVYKDPETGKYLTEIQKFQLEHPLEFVKQIGLWYVLTDGGKNSDNFVKSKVASAKKKSFQNLERVINASALNPDGTLNYAGGDGNASDVDPLTEGGWDIVTG